MNGTTSKCPSQMSCNSVTKFLKPKIKSIFKKERKQYLYVPCLVNLFPDQLQLTNVLTWSVKTQMSSYSPKPQNRTCVMWGLSEFANTLFFFFFSYDIALNEGTEHRFPNLNAQPTFTQNIQKKKSCVLVSIHHCILTHSINNIKI